VPPAVTLGARARPPLLPNPTPLHVCSFRADDDPYEDEVDAAMKAMKDDPDTPASAKAKKRREVAANRDTMEPGALRVLSVCVPSGNRSTTVVMVNAAGDYVDAVELKGAQVCVGGPWCV
jgi:hypothetical protein